MKRALVSLILVALTAAAPQLLAGVVIEMGAKDSSGRETPGDKIHAQSGMVRVDIAGTEDAMSMIFRDEAILIIDHKKKTVAKMDQAAMEEVSSQMNEAMKQMEEQLASMPPEQRAMVEKMMKGKMKEMMPDQAEGNDTAYRVESVGSGQWQDYSCSKYAAYLGSEKIQEICAAPVSQVDGADEAMEAFKEMAKSMTKMLESVKGPFANLASNPMQMINQIEGFPVHTRHFEKGELDRETFLKSSTQESLDDSHIAAPSGNKEEDLFKR